MNEYFKKIKELKLGKKNLLLIALGALSLCFLFASELCGGEEEMQITTENTAEFSQQYIKATVKELEALLEKIDGAGEVRVMLTLESCYENIYAKGYYEKGAYNESNNQYESEEEYIIVKKGANNEESLVIKVNEPEIKGVAVVAQGAGDTGVKSAITQTVCALFNISSAKVSVEKMIN